MARLVELALLFVAGDVMGLRWPSPPVAFAASAGSLAVLVTCFVLPAGRLRARPIFLLLGFVTGAGGARSAALDCRAGINDGALISAVAVMAGVSEPASIVAVHVEAMTVDGSVARRCRGEFRARLSAGAQVGSGAVHVRLRGRWWKSPYRSGWPTRPERTGVLAIQSLTTVDTAHSHVLLALRAHAQSTVRRRFRREAPLAESLLLANRETLDRGVRQDFAAAGLAHLLAISGAHVGILAGLVLLLAGVCRLRARASAIAATGVVVAYVSFLGAPTAATRAAIQGVAVLASRLTQRPADPFALLALAGLVIAALDPLSPLEPGFQLSFAGVFGLLAFGPTLRNAIGRDLPAAVSIATASTLAATAVTAPIAAWHFGLVSFIGPVSNLIAAPMLALAVPAMAVALVAGPIHESAGSFLAGGAEVVLRLLRETARLAAALPGGHAWVPADSVTALVLGMAAFAVCGPAVRARIGKRRAGGAGRTRGLRLVVRAGIAASVFAMWPLLRPSGGELVIHAIDVGQGDALAIRTPRGRWIVVDAGPASATFDAGRDRVAPYLRNQGVHRLDLLILTHPDADHIGGARAIMEAFPVAVVVDPAVATGKDLYIETLEAARRGGETWLAARAGRVLLDEDVTLRVLAPEDSLLDASADANDVSVVFRLEYGRFAALFLGDSPRYVEDRLVARYGDALESDLIKVGHHGSSTSTGDSLLNAVQPRVGLISVGRRNRYGHPARIVLDRLARHGVGVARTDENGSIVVRARPDGTMETLTAR